jgi:hypothetical protein
MTFEEFASAHLAAVLRFAAVLAGDRAAADDLAQEVLIRAYSRADPATAVAGTSGRRVFHRVPRDHELRLGATSAPESVRHENRFSGSGQIQLWNHMRPSQEVYGRVTPARTGYR